VFALLTVARVEMCVDQPNWCGGSALSRPVSRSGRHRNRASTPEEWLVRRLSPRTYAARLGLSVTALVGALGAGATLLPASVTGSGISAESAAAAIAALAPSAGPTPGSTATPPASTPPTTAPPTTSPAASGTPAARQPTTEPASPATRKASPKPAATTKAAFGLAAEENEVLRLVNLERRKAGCGTVTLDTRLRTAIRLHVRELATHDGLYLSHVSDDGRTFVQRAAEQGYDAAGGENVARGQRDAAAVMDGWMDSAGHRANILNCSFRAVGVGAVKGVDQTIVWGQLFGRS
jgi:uncharacterized protein YkwD